MLLLACRGMHGDSSPAFSDVHNPVAPSPKVPLRQQPFLPPHSRFLGNFLSGGGAEKGYLALKTFSSVYFLRNEEVPSKGIKNSNCTGG